jgi:inner membrane protein
MDNITHGFPALLILPFLLAGLMRLWDQHVRLRRDRQAMPSDFRQLVILSAISIATHPTLDFMNTYGMRWLVPFVDRWFYADGLFIVDLWLLVALVLGVLWSRRAGTTRPARFALGFVAAYSTAMLIVTGVGRERVEAQHRGQRTMVEPNPVLPWRRTVLLEEASAYRFGTYSLFGGLDLSAQRLPKEYAADDPAIRQAKAVPDVIRFLRWARFPMYAAYRRDGHMEVLVSDARYDGAGWASVQVTLP